MWKKFKWIEIKCFYLIESKRANIAVIKWESRSNSFCLHSLKMSSKLIFLQPILILMKTLFPVEDCPFTTSFRQLIS